MNNEWSQRVQSADGMCLSCLKFHGHTAGFCSNCFHAIQSSLPWLQILVKEDVFAAVSVEAMLEAVVRMKRNMEAAETADREALLQSLDRAVQPVFMPSQIFNHLLRSLRGAAETTPPAALARLLLDLGHPLMSASQASDVLAVLRAVGTPDYKVYHVVCSRVVDRWNLVAKDHGIGQCYYGWSEHITSNGLKKLLYPTDAQTLGTAL